MILDRKKSKTEADSETKREEILDKETENDNSESKKAKRRDLFISVFSVVCALTIWFYASAIHETELKDSSRVNLKYILDAENKGYEIHYNYDTEINYTLKGKASALSQISGNVSIITVDLSTIKYSEIESEKIVQLPLTFNLPEGVVCAEKSKEYIEITITKKSID